MPTEQEWQQHLKSKTGAQCGKCGRDLTYETDAGNGFCIECQEEEDSKE